MSHTVENNGVVLSFIPVDIKRGDNKGGKYLHIDGGVNVDNLTQYIKFRGEDVVAGILNGRERIIAQEATRKATFGDNEFDLECWNALIKNPGTSAESIPDIRLRIEGYLKQLEEIDLDSAEALVKVRDIRKKITDANAAIEAKRRTKTDEDGE